MTFPPRSTFPLPARSALLALLLTAWNANAAGEATLESLALKNLEPPGACTQSRLYGEEGYQATLQEHYTGYSPLAPAPMPSALPPYLPRTLFDPVACEMPLPPLTRETSEIEALMRSLAPKPPVEIGPLDLACVAVAQKHFGQAGWGFAHCSKGKANLIPNRSRANASAVPCRTLSQVSLVAHAFKNVSQCLGIDPREIFKVFSKESGMMLNSRSHTGARGIGQMTLIAMQHVQDVDEQLQNGATSASLKLARRFNANILGDDETEPKPECAPLQPLVGERLSRSQLANPCSMIELPKGLFRSMLFSMKLYSYYRAEIEAIVASMGMKDKLGKDYEEIVQAASAYSYSAAGPGNTRPALKALLLASKRNYRGKETFLAQLKANLMRRAPRVAHEIRHYVDGGGSGLKERYAAIKNELGGRECF